MLVKFNTYANANTFVKVDGHDWLQTFKYKTRELWGLFAEVRKKNLSWDFEVIYIFRKIAVLNICRYLRGFYTYQNSQKSVELFLLKNANQKLMQHAYK